MPVIFLRSVLIALHDRILEKYQAHCRELGEDPSIYKGYEVYGYKKSPRLSIKKMMEEDSGSGPLIKSLKFNLNGNYLYKRYRDALNGVEEINLSPDYMQIFLRFIGFSQKESFLESSAEISKSIEERQLQLWGYKIVKSDKSVEKLLEFHGFYYSLENHEVRSFVLNIDISKDLRDRETPNFILTQYKANLLISLGGSTLKYSGRANRVGEFLHINLWTQNNVNVRGANLILRIGAAKLLRSIILSGIYSSNTVMGDITSGEVLLIKRKFLDAGDFGNLMMRKYVFTKAKQVVSPRNVPNSISILEKETYDQSGRALKDYVGTYEIYYMKGNDTMIISHLIIREDYQVTFQSPFTNYYAFFRVSNSGNNFYLWFIRPVTFKTDFFCLIDLTREVNILNVERYIYPGNILYIERGGYHKNTKCLIRRIDESENLTPPRYFDKDTLREEGDEYALILSFLKEFD